MKTPTGDNTIKTMVLDLSYINEMPSDAQEEAIKKAVEEQCMLSIITYLTEVADTMDANNIETLNAASLRAMADQLNQRLTTNEESAD